MACICLRNIERKNEQLKTSSITYQSALADIYYYTHTDIADSSSTNTFLVCAGSAATASNRHCWQNVGECSSAHL